MSEREREKRRAIKKTYMMLQNYEKATGVIVPLCIIFKFSFKWLSAFTVCKIQIKCIKIL